MPKVLVIGKHSQILPFKSVGVEPVDVESIDDAKDALRSIRESGEETLVLIPEELALECANEIALLRQGVNVVVMTLPAMNGEVGAQRENVRQLVARSLGVDLMGKR
ncbi:MAG: V-type ATP synthase subunit F [Planctomycetaceae bacterium]|nr:V-type ATP synthase subunit F [Planctomycetaceae bacterium]